MLGTFLSFAANSRLIKHKFVRITSGYTLHEFYEFDLP